MAFPGLDNSPIKRVTVVDSAGNPITPALLNTSQTLAANNTTAATALFGLTGVVEILRLWFIITTDLGSNITAAYYRLNDQTAQVDVTLNTGTAFSAFKAGSGGYKKGITTVALAAINNSAGRVNDSGTANEFEDFGRCIITKKTAATTNIEFVYTTTNTPTSGVIQHFVEYRPVSSDGSLAVL